MACGDEKSPFSLGGEMLRQGEGDEGGTVPGYHVGSSRLQIPGFFFIELFVSGSGQFLFHKTYRMERAGTLADKGKQFVGSGIHSVKLRFYFLY